VIVPPSWIVKVPRKGSFKSSLKTSPNKKKKKGGGGGRGSPKNAENPKVEKIDEGEPLEEDVAVMVRKHSLKMAFNHKQINQL
jgi:hypothetical protein